MPIQTGLYTVIFPTLIFALLGSSQAVGGGRDSATAAVPLPVSAGLGIAGDAEHAQWVAWRGLTALALRAVSLFLARLLKLERSGTS